METPPPLTIGAVARRLGVAVETLRSWEPRYGIGPSDHVPGTRRRYTAADVDRLERFCRLVGSGAAAPEAARAVLDGADSRIDAGAGRVGGGRTLPVGRSGSAAARGLARSAVRLDTAQVLDLLEAVIAQDGVVEAWERTISPALLAVGRKWSETSGRYVEVEHMLSWCVTAALHRLRPAPPDPAARRRAVLLACAPGEWHHLPVDVLCAALGERGVPVCMLGPAVPSDALRAAAQRIAPSHTVVWSQTPGTADPSCLPAAPRGRCVTLAAGPGWLGSRIPIPFALTSLADALEACSNDLRPIRIAEHPE